MPNWVSNILAVSGPQHEVKRFVDCCIRPSADDGELEFNFEAVRPMPAVITTTLGDSSDQAAESARHATGHDGWYLWRLAFWGTKWNASSFSELLSTPDTYVCYFETAWSYPQALLDEFALQYPLIRAQTLSMDPSMNWAMVGDICGGRHTYEEVGYTRKLRYLVHEADPRACLPPTVGPEVPDVLKALGVEAAIQGIHDRTSGEARIQQAWQQAHNISSPEMLALWELREDVDGFLDWFEREYEGRGFPSRAIAQAALDDGFVALERNLDFMFEEKRCATVVDRDVLVSAVIAAQKSVDEDCSPQQLEQLLGALLRPYSDEELREWAALAMYRKGVLIKACDQDTLHESVIDFAVKLLEKMDEHVREVAASLQVGDAPIVEGGEQRRLALLQ